MLIDDTVQDPRWRFWPNFEYIRNWMGVPLLVDDELVGMYGIDKCEPHFFTHDHVQRVELLAAQGAVAIRNARLYSEMESAQREQQALARRLVDVGEAERRALARELHDEIGQSLTGLGMLLEVQSKHYQGNAELKESGDIVRDLIGKVRDLSLDVRPSMLDDLGLLPALLWQLRRFTRQTTIAVDFSHTGLERKLPPDVNTAVYRIVQEALTNVARHANVATVQLRIRVQPQSLRLRIADAGAGFDPAAVQAAYNSSGLSGMRERAVSLGGSLTIASAPGRGTEINADIPLYILDIVS